MRKVVEEFKVIKKQYEKEEKPVPMDEIKTHQEEIK